MYVIKVFKSFLSCWVSWAKFLDITYRKIKLEEAKLVPNQNLYDGHGVYSRDN